MRKYRLKSEEPYPSLTSRRSHTPNPENRSDIHGYRSYGMEEKYERDVNIQSNVNIPRRRDVPHHWTQNYTSNLDPGYRPSYGLVPSSNPTYGGVNTSAMQRYAPRLDELNHTRMNHVGSRLPLPDTSGVFHPPVPRHGFQAGSFGFAPGPHRPFPKQNSSGWLNE